MTSLGNSKPVKFQVIITGTGPDSKKGGISFAIPGYFAALDSASIPYSFHETYRPDFYGKTLLWLTKIPGIINDISRAKQSGLVPIVYSHAGSGVSLFREGAIQGVSKLFGAKTAIQIHCPEADGYVDHPVKRVLFKLALSGVDLIFGLLPWWKERFRGSNIHRNISFIPNPIPANWEERAKRKRTAKENGKITILFMARIEEKKGADIAIDAMRLLANKDVNLLIAGTGSFKDSLMKRVEGMPEKNRINFLGWVSGDEKQRLFDEADIFCLPSSNDAMSIGFLEAMVNGLPIVALDWGPTNDLVVDGKVGLLAKSYDGESVAKLIIKLADSDKLRDEMGQAGKEWTLDQFTSEKTGRLLLEEFNRLCADEK